jgi:predicted dehydrogenase
MARWISRRGFLKGGAAAGTFLVVSPRIARAFEANAKLRMAVIGAGGMGGQGVRVGLDEHAVAVADADPEGRGAQGVAQLKGKFPDIRVYADYRKLFDAHPKLDAAWVATPDHNHFGATLRALEAGAGVYCEKPLTHNVYEARKIREVARAKGLTTQMGNQGHSSESIRLLCEYVWQGTLGDVTEVHALNGNDGAHYSAGRPAPVPKGMDWDAWLGPAAWREYVSGPHPVGWRGWIDFGTGILGDWFCHNADGAVWALKLNEADTVEVECELGKPTENNFCPKLRVAWRFPKRGEMAPVTLRWFLNERLPRPPALEAGREVKGLASVYYGTKGMAVGGSHMGGVRLIPESFQQAVGRPKQVLPRAGGSHRNDFLSALRAGRKACSDFDYSARLTEIMHLGNIASRIGGKLTYDFRTGRFVNDPKADALLKRQPRKGWELGYV